MIEKKIGIVTYWDTEENYGQVLQLFALQWQLKKLSYNPYLIRIKHGKLPTDINQKYAVKTYTFQRIVDALKKRFFKRKKYTVIKRNFQLFKDKYLSVSDKEYVPLELYTNTPKADAYISGSDQVWNYPNPIFFLDWCPTGKKRIAYAASFGKKDIPDYQVEVYSKLLGRMDLISVREKSGVGICEKIVPNKECIQCLDPTLLLSKEDYMSSIQIEEPLTDKKYILLYLLGNKCNVNFSLLNDFAKEKDCEIIFVPSQGCVLSMYKPTYPSVEQWLGLVKNAAYIITNSFHGTAFSIIFQRDFFVFPLVGGDVKMNDRLTSLFDTLEIENRYVCKKMLQKDHLDYGKIAKILKEKKKEGMFFLNEINRYIL